MKLQHLITALVSIACLSCSTSRGSDDLEKEALAAARVATEFLTQQVSTQGGYLWRYSSDLSLREGEGDVTTETVWIQPPGTPSVGEAFVRLYEATGEEQFLDAARAAAEALRLGQMVSGGWQAQIEFEPDRRSKWAYRTNVTQSRKAKDQSSLDDDKTQSALRFVMQLDRALEFKDPQVHEMAMYALEGLLGKGQLPGGGFPQVWTESRIGHDSQPQSTASFPDSWSRQYPGHREYWYRYTLNDNLAPDVFKTLMMAEEIYGGTKYQDAALKLADFLLLAQLPEPQPAWAQQYNFALQPIWARKFEPPAVTGGESQGVIKTLMLVFEKTGEGKYLRPIPRALDYLERSRLPDGRLARFYELETNRPLYFTKDYQLTYDDSDLPTHYAFKVSSRLGKLRHDYQRLRKQVGRQPAQSSNRSRVAKQTKPSQKRIREIIDSMDPRGAWITSTGLRFHKRTGPVIDMRVAVENLNNLADFLDEE